MNASNALCLGVRPANWMELMCTVHLAMCLNISMLDNVTPLAHLPLSASENMIKTMSSKEDNASIVKEAV